MSVLEQHRQNRGEHVSAVMTAECLSSFTDFQSSQLTIDFGGGSDQVLRGLTQVVSANIYQIDPSFGPTKVCHKDLGRYRDFEVLGAGWELPDGCRVLKLRGVSLHTGTPNTEVKDQPCYLVMEPTPAVSMLSPGQFSLWRAYREAARVGGPVNLLPTLSLKGVMYGKLSQVQLSFLTPSGKHLNWAGTIGLPKDTVDHRLFFVERTIYQAEPGYWLGIQARERASGVLRKCYIFVVDIDGQERIAVKRTEGQWALRMAYAVREPTNFVPPLEAKDAIVPGDGATSKHFIDPSEREIGEYYTLGFGQYCRAYQIFSSAPGHEEGHSGFWLGFQARNKDTWKPVRRHVFVAGPEGHAEILRTWGDGQWSLAQAYAVTGRTHFSPPLPASGVIYEATGLTSKDFLYPSLRPAPRDRSLGVGMSKTGHHIHSSEPATFQGKQGFWLEFGAFDTDTNEIARSFVFIPDDRTEPVDQKKWATLSAEQKELWDAMETARRVGSLECQIDASPFMGPSMFRDRLLLSTGQPRICRSGMRALAHSIKEVIDPRFSRISWLEPETFLLTISYGETAPYGKIVLRTTSSDVSVVAAAEQSDIERADIIKGATLDRLLDHVLHSESDLRSNQEYQTSAFPYEIMRPNASNHSSVVHAKWGNRGHDVLQYLQRYTRLLKTLGQPSPTLRMLVVSLAHQSQLAECAGILSNDTGVQIIVRPLLDEAKDRGVTEVLGYSLAAELNRIENAAECGEVDWLSNRSYSPSLQRGTKIVSRVTPATEVLPGEAEILAALALQERVFSPYDEHSYHLERAIFCSRVLQSSFCNDEMRAIIRRLYKELEGTTDEIDILAAALEALGEARCRGGLGQPPELLPFDLSVYLLRREPQPEAVNSISANPSGPAPIFDGSVRSAEFVAINQWIRDLTRAKVLEATLPSMRCPSLSDKEIDDLLHHLDRRLTEFFSKTPMQYRAAFVSWMQGEIN